MSATHPIAASLALILLVAACRSDGPRDADAVPDENGEVARTTIDPPSRAPQEAVMDNGTQVLEIAVTPDGFQPASVAVSAREPVRMVFTRTTAQACGDVIQIPVAEIVTAPLAVGLPVEVEYVPGEAGVFQFVCGVDALRGRLVVNE